jgi:hypothetical protein
MDGSEAFPFGEVAMLRSVSLGSDWADGNRLHFDVGGEKVGERKKIRSTRRLHEMPRCRGSTYLATCHSRISDEETMADGKVVMRKMKSSEVTTR